MDYKLLCSKKEQLKQLYEQLPKEVLQSFDKSFEIEYTHNSTAIEGNTLSLIQTKAVLEDGISVGGKTLREIYEVVNHDKAFGFIKKCIAEGKALDEKIIKDIHALLMDNIITGGIYRNVEVRITGAKHKPPMPNEMYQQIKNFYADMPYKANGNDIELAAWTHAEFVKVHPFVDGNGRTSRMIMNYQLMASGFLPVSIAKENRLEYFEALEEYAVDGNLNPFAEMIAVLEEERLDEYLGIAQEQAEQEGPTMTM
ncbi:MAG: Fic family protein [Lachnospiraceae bacterium]|nr:Fic family protein [Lachnospiraceae bacterium]